jgi:hypothetical protein
MGGGGTHRVTSQTNILRYAPYIEDHHYTFLNLVAQYRAATIGDNPFTGYTTVEIDDAFFGTGYTISSFPALYDMYGKFMAGLDVDALYTQTYEDIMNSGVVNALVANEANMMDDDIDTNIMPRFKEGMRDINSVLSSSFVVGKAVIEDARTKALSKFSAGLKYQTLPLVTERWKTHLEWNKNVTMTYAEIMKLYYSAVMDIDDHNYALGAQARLWPFTVLEYEKAALGALQGAQVSTSKGVAGSGGASTASKAITGAISGAAAGSAINFPYGTIIGGVVGLAAGLLS